MTLADYLLRANVCLAGLFGLYWLLFRRHTFFALNRAYLLLSLVTAALLPLVELPTETVEAARIPTVSLPVMGIAVTQTPDFSLTDALWWGYGVGAALCAGWLLLGFWRVVRLIASGERVARFGYTLMLVKDSRLSPFSFFRYLVISRSDFEQQTETDTGDALDSPVFRHELVHIRQWHSVDVLLAEVVKCLCWCNPVAWWLPRALQQTHEFLADQSATDAALPPADYARFLVGYALGAKPQEARTLLITNSFAEFSQLKNRIIMLKTNPTNRRAIWLYALALPVVALLTSLVADRYSVSAFDVAAQGKLITVSGLVLDEQGGPFSGANIVVMGKRKGTNTDLKGNFELTGVPANAALMVSFVGFKSEVIRAGSKEITFVVRLKRNPTTLDEVVIATYPTSTTRPAVNTSPLPSPPSSLSAADEIFTVVEQQPEYPGGLDELGRFIAKNLRYPSPAARGRVQGRVFVQFVVSETGEIRDTRILKGIGFGCDEEALRVMQAMPLWLPGKQNGKPVAVQYNLPINFAIEQAQKPASGSSMPAVPSSPLPSDSSTSRVRVGGLNVLEVGREPLYIVDGVELKDGQTISTIDPNTIESLNVLKGTSAEPYGAKGVNGVILIKTKKTAKKP